MTAGVLDHFKIKAVNQPTIAATHEVIFHPGLDPFAVLDKGVPHSSSRSSADLRAQ